MSSGSDAGADEADRCAPGAAERHGHPHHHRRAIDLDQGLRATHPPARAADEDGARDRVGAGIDCQCVIGRDARGVELSEERRATLCLVVLADGRGHLLQPAQRPQETVVGRLRPPHVAEPRQPLARECVEAAVVPDPIRGVALDRVASDIAECRPGVERAWWSATTAATASRHLRRRLGERLVRAAADSSFDLGEHGGRRPSDIAIECSLTDEHSWSKLGPIVLTCSALSLKPPGTARSSPSSCLVALAIASAWLMKSIAQKVALVIVLGLLAVLVWTQRASLDDCAKRVKSDRAASASGDSAATRPARSSARTSPSKIESAHPTQEVARLVADSSGADCGHPVAVTSPIGRPAFSSAC